MLRMLLDLRSSRSPCNNLSERMPSCNVNNNTTMIFTRMLALIIMSVRWNNRRGSSFDLNFRTFVVCHFRQLFARMVAKIQIPLESRTYFATIGVRSLVIRLLTVQLGYRPISLRPYFYRVQGPLISSQSPELDNELIFKEIAATIRHFCR